MPIGVRMHGLAHDAVGVCVCVCLFALFAVNAQADCDASERTVLKCIFPRNVNSTPTDFSVYFQFDNGYEGTLVFLCTLS